MEFSGLLSYLTLPSSWLSSWPQSSQTTSPGVNVRVTLAPRPRSGKSATTSRLSHDCVMIFWDILSTWDNKHVRYQQMKNNLLNVWLFTRICGSAATLSGKYCTTGNRKHRQAAAKMAACARPLMLSTLGTKGKRGECEKKAERKLNTQPSAANIEKYRIIWLKPDAPSKLEKESWHICVSSINSRTSIKKVWTMVPKISGKYSNTVPKSITLKVICNSFSQNWWKVLSSCLLQYQPSV